LYILYFLFTKSKFYFSIPVIFLVLIDQTLNSETLYLKDRYETENFKKNEYEYINIYNNIRNYIHYSILFIIILGFIHYYIRQKYKFKGKFSVFKFIFDINCKKGEINF